MHAAWLTEVGHKRPGMKPGLPLAEARELVAKLERENAFAVEVLKQKARAKE